MFLGPTNNPLLQQFDVSLNQLTGSLPLDYLVGEIILLPLWFNLSGRRVVSCFCSQAEDTLGMREKRGAG